MKNKVSLRYFVNDCSKSFISNHLECLNRVIDEYSKKYQNVLFLGDFNATINEKCMEEFCNLNGFSSLIKKPTWFKYPVKPACIDLILTNQPNCFQHSNVYNRLPETATEYSKLSGL